MHEYAFFFCLLNFFIISSHGFSCLQTSQMDFLCAQTFCGSRTVESYVSTSENNDTLAHSGLLTKTCITQEINIEQNTRKFTAFHRKTDTFVCTDSH